MAGGRIGGQGSMPKRVIWVFIAACIVVAVWNTFPHDPKGFYQELGNKSEQLKGVAGDVVDWLGISSLGSGSDAPQTPGEGGKADPAEPRPAKGDRAER